MERLLLVDDDRLLLSSLTCLFSREGYHVTTAETILSARARLEESAVDLMLLDINLPSGDGISFCRQVRARHHFPILMLTARDSLADRVIGLEVGADDYITKPFQPLELLARVRAHLRRAGGGAVRGPDGKIALGPVVVDVGARDALRDGRPVGLTHVEFLLLHLLARHRNKPLASDWIVDQVWGFDGEAGRKTLAVYIRRVRRKIERDPARPVILITVRGFGYQVVTPEARQRAS
jgi:DNA-binding response OmpR family regulator